MLAPLLRTLWRQATAAASWLLVCLVGQAVALFRRGVQQGSQAAAAAAPGASQQRRPGRRRQAQQAQGGPGEDAQQQQPVSGQQPGWAW